jgi:hypothetical protein
VIDRSGRIREALMMLDRWSDETATSLEVEREAQACSEAHEEDMRMQVVSSAMRSAKLCDVR